MTILFIIVAALSAMAFIFGLVFASICYGYQRILIAFLSCLPVVNIILVAYIFWVEFKQTGRLL